MLFFLCYFAAGINPVLRCQTGAIPGRKIDAGARFLIVTGMNGDKHALKEVARVFFKLGCIGFGGPAVHIAMMEKEVV